MRLKSEIFVQSLLRLHSISGHFATVLNKGAEEAGAIFICHQVNREQASFYGQVPQSLILEGEGGERHFETLAINLTEGQISEKIATQKRFDPDCWVVELEGGELPEIILLRDTL